VLEPDIDTTDAVAEKCTKHVVFNIRDLARTTGLVITVKTRQNVQKRGFCTPKSGCFGVAGLLS